MIHPRQYLFCIVASGLLASITLLPWGPLEVFEFKTLDVRMWVRDRLDEPTPRSEVRTLVIDDADLMAALQGGAEAGRITSALSAIIASHTAANGVVGIELPRWHPVATTLYQQVLQTATGRERPAMPAGASVVIGMRSGNADEQITYGLQGFSLLPLQHEVPDASTPIRVGAIECPGDNDGVVRRLPLVFENDGQLYPTFLLQLIAAHDGVRLSETQLRLGRSLDLVRAGRVVRRIPVDDRGRVLVNYRERPADARLSALSPEALAAPVPRIVLVATTARGVVEAHSVPLGGRVPDSEVLAEALQTILSNDTIVRVGRWSRFFLTWTILLLGALGMVRLPSWRGVVLGFGIVAAYFLVEKALFIGANVWLPFMLPVVAFTWGAAVFPVYGFRWRAKHHMEEMRLLRRYDDLVLMNIAGGLIVADRYGMVLRHNPRAAELLGLSGEALNGQHVRELFAVSPAMLELLGQVMRSSYDAGAESNAAPRSTRVAVPSRAGEIERTFALEVALVDIELLRSPPHADLPCYVLTFDDITEQVVRAQEEARRARLAAVGEIAAKLGHEIRNSLGGLRLYVENIREEIAPNGSGHRAIANMVREIDSLNRKMDDLRQFGADPQLQKTPCDLKELLDEALTYANQRLSQKHVRVVLECERPLPPLVVDRRKLREALQNIINNAIEAAPEGGRVAIQVERAYRGNGARAGGYRIHIEDNGPGIPPDIREHVFSMFFTTKPDIGTGLGLPIAKKIVESHGGHLSFTSDPKAGTCFTVNLPAPDESEAPT